MGRHTVTIPNVDRQLLIQQLDWLAEVGGQRPCDECLGLENLLSVILHACDEQNVERLSVYGHGRTCTVWNHAFECLEIEGPAGTVFLQGDDADTLRGELSPIFWLTGQDYRRAFDIVCRAYDSIAQPSEG
jgi:hypothetical protein